jgi:hypothetical protein
VSRPGLVLDSSDAGPGGVGGTPPEVWVNLAVLAVLLGYLLLEIANKTSKAIAPVGPSRLLFSCVVMEGRDSHCHRGAADWSDTESCDQPAQRDAHLGEFVGGLLGLGNAGGGDLGRGRYPGDVVSDLPAASRAATRSIASSVIGPNKMAYFRTPRSVTSPVWTQANIRSRCVGTGCRSFDGRAGTNPSCSGASMGS